MNVFDFDITVVKVLNHFAVFPLNYFLVAVIYSVYAFLIFFVYTFYKSKKHKDLCHLFLVSIVGYILVASLKFLFANTSLSNDLLQRPGNLRPYDLEPSINILFKKADPAFPSSHAFFAFMALVFIPKKTSKWLKAFAFLYLGILIPFASIATGVHYFSDVVVGGLLGVILPFLIPKRISNYFVNKLFQLKIFK